MWALAAALAAIGTIGGQLRWNSIRYIKTGATVTFLVLAVRAALMGLHPTLSIGFSVSLAVATIADYLLGKPDNSDVFQAGLAAFLIAYLTYAIVLLIAVPDGGIPVWPTVAIAVAGVAIAGVQYHTLQLPDDLKLPVILYVVVVTFFLFSGALFVLSPLVTNGVFTWHQGAIAIGVAFIYVSDSLIAHNLFRSPLPNDELFVMPTYYIGQAAMVAALYAG